MSQPFACAVSRPPPLPCVGTRAWGATTRVRSRVRSFSVYVFSRKQMEGQHGRPDLQKACQCNGRSKWAARVRVRLVGQEMGSTTAMLQKGGRCLVAGLTSRHARCARSPIARRRRQVNTNVSALNRVLTMDLLLGTNPGRRAYRSTGTMPAWRSGRVFGNDRWPRSMPSVARVFQGRSRRWWKEGLSFRKVIATCRFGG